MCKTLLSFDTQECISDAPVVIDGFGSFSIGHHHLSDPAGNGQPPPAAAAHQSRLLTQHQQVSSTATTLVNYMAPLFAFTVISS